VVLSSVFWLPLLILPCYAFIMLRKSCLVRSFPKAVDKQRKVVGRKCAGGDCDVAGKTIHHTDDENKKQEQCDPPYPQATVASNNNHNDIIGSPTASTTELVATYVASYEENGKLCYLRTNMVFTSLRSTGGRGFAIDGSGSDSDGTCNIIEGRIAPDGQAYWIERQGSRRILSMGFFTTSTKMTSSLFHCGIDEDAGTVPEFFHGRWRSSNGVAAFYDSFALDTKNQKQQPVAVVTTASTATTADTMHQEHDIESGASERAPAAAA
jgi:hypothetical protein